MPANKTNTLQFTDVLIFSDSYGHRGYEDKDDLMGFIPMNSLSGVNDLSLTGRFTNKEAWTDEFGRLFANAGGFGEPNLSDPIRITNNTGNIIVRTYCKGGATAAEWSLDWREGVTQNGARASVSTLAYLRKQAMAHYRSKLETAKTLVIEGMGANDMLTVDDWPSIVNAQKAIAARMENITKLAEHGYRHFCLLNMPDMSLVPRFQDRKKYTDEKRQELSILSENFNTILSKEVNQLRQLLAKKYGSDISIVIHDAAADFKAVYDDPARFGLDPAKKNIAFNQTADFGVSKDISNVEGYMFVDDVHASHAAQKHMAHSIFESQSKRGILKPEKEPLLKIFREHYSYALAREKTSWCAFCCGRSDELNYMRDTLTIEEVFRQAIFGKATLAREVLINSLEWINEKNEVNVALPDVQKVAKIVYLQHQETDTKQEVVHSPQPMVA